ncbi:MAG: DUF4157 domain-containing protein [Bacteroidales bacterium]|nr:DUF4157 domain-containing protein [Bacteroidales bacterium]
MKKKAEQTLDKDRNMARAAAEFAVSERHPVAIMPKLEVGQSGDRYEQEADQVADRIMQMPENNVIRKSDEEEDKIQMKSQRTEVTPWLQRFGNREILQARSDHAVEETSWLGNQLTHSKSNGKPLPEAPRSFMESRFGADFGNVKIHADNNASTLSHAINAKAFTHGSDIYFAKNQFSPETQTGKHLLAHELTHVVQQTFSSSPSISKKSGGTAYSQAKHHVTKGVNRVVQMTQEDDESRRSRIDVATSVQAFRATYPDESGGLLTQALIRQLQRAQTAGEATSAVGSGQRRFGSRAGSAEERAGVSLGQASSPPENETAEKVAVVIGNGNYDENTNMGSMAVRNRPLTTTISDAESVAARMRDLNYVVTLLTDQNATQINQELTNQINRLQQGSELFFYFSGHGLIEGLVGIDGSVFTPAQMVAIRDTARSNLVNLVINTDACHSGVFADAIRGAELTDTLRANQSQSTPSLELTAMLQGALDIQSAKNNFNTSINTWWAQRYEIENRMNVAATEQVITEWENHYNQGRDIWNNFVTACNPLLVTLRSSAGVAGLTLEALTLPTLTGNLNSDKEAQIQAGLDDVDNLLNQVLTYSNNRLP